MSFSSFESSSQPRRAITKSLAIKSQSFGSESSQSNESLYSYNYNIWSPVDIDTSAISSSSDGTSSPPSSTSMEFNGSPIADSVEPLKASSSKRQLPSSKAQAEVISKCIEKNIKYRHINKVLMCSFCKNNGESEVIYRSHSLKDSVGRITCPLLRNYVCPICGESGQNAHTITYCKLFKKSKQTSILANDTN